MKNFTLKGLLWKETLQLNLVRSVVAGLIWGVIGLIISTTEPAYDPVFAFVMPVTIPLFYFFFFLPLAIVAGFLSRIGIPFVGLLSFFPAIIIFPADPFVFFLHKKIPSLVPSENYRFIDPVLTIWVFEQTITDYTEKSIPEV